MIKDKYFNITSTGVEQSGIMYQRPALTDQTRTIVNGDNGWHTANGTYDYDPPANPTHVAQLDYNDAEPFLTLRENNAFGNTYRFTDENGGQTYTNHYVIDHYTGLGWYKGHRFGFGSDYTTRVTNCHTATDFSFSDWRMPNRNEMLSIMVNDRPPAGVDPMDYPPFNYQPNYRFNTSTLYYASNQHMIAYIGCAIESELNTYTSDVTWMCRNHYN